MIPASVTVRVEWDMGHRLPRHNGKCSRLHGHRYVAEVTVQGPVRNTPDAPDEGMIVDFGDLKNRLRELVEVLDHNTLISVADPWRDVLRVVPGVRIVPYVPTAENIALDLLNSLPEIKSIKLYETPTSFVVISR